MPLRNTRKRSRRRTGSPRLRWVGTALLGGLLSAVLGTALHGHIAYAGNAALPAGAAAALLMAGAVMVWCGLWARTIIASALCGGTAYVLVALLSRSSKTLILTGTTGDTALPTALAGNIWLFGLALISVLSVAVCAVVLRKSGEAAIAQV